MPPRAVHVAQARRNLSVVEHLLAQDTEATRQWAAIAAFYCALHCIEAYVAGNGNRHYYNHESRRNAIASSGDRNLTDVYSAYLLLENRASDARYNGHLYSRAEVETIVRNYLGKIRPLAGV